MNLKKVFKNVLDLFRKSNPEQTEEAKVAIPPKLRNPNNYKCKKREMRVDLPGEKWRRLEKYPEYDISNMGRICHRAKDYILKPGVTRGRYYYSIHNKSNSIYQLMCDTFFEKPEVSNNERYMPHLINGDAKDPRVENLAWKVYEYDRSKNLKSYRIVQPTLKKSKPTKPASEPIEEPRMELEEWRIVEDYPKYSISSLGRIKSNKTGKILNSGGYTSVRLVRSPDDVGSVTIISLVANAFVPKPKISDNDKLRVATINGDKTDVRASNIQWIVCKSSKDGKNDKNEMTIAQYRADGKLVRKYRDIDEVVDTHRHFDCTYVEYLLESGEPDRRKFIWKKI